MRIRLTVNGERFHKDCHDHFVWRGTRRGAPAWIVGRIDRGDAIISPHGSITLKDKNGYHTADKGKLILYYGDDQIEVLWGFKRDRRML